MEIDYVQNAVSPQSSLALSRFQVVMALYISGSECNSLKNHTRNDFNIPINNNCTDKLSIIIYIHGIQNGSLYSISVTCINH